MQVNIGREDPKRIWCYNMKAAINFVKYCKNDLKLNIIGLMCIPPVDKNPDLYFKNLID